LDIRHRLRLDGAGEVRPSRPPAERGTAPRYLRCDNGTELTAYALRDWCRSSGTGTSYIEPESPWENPYVESFNGRLRDELLAIEEFGTLLKAQVVIEAWRGEYKTQRPHSSPGLAQSGCLCEALEGTATSGTVVRGGLVTGGQSHLRWPGD